MFSAYVVEIMEYPYKYEFSFVPNMIICYTGLSFFCLTHEDDA